MRAITVSARAARNILAVTDSDSAIDGSWSTAQNLQGGKVDFLQTRRFDIRSFINIVTQLN